MARLIADLQEYKYGFRKNYESYKSLHRRNEHLRSRTMLLAYCGECGLKYLLLKGWQIFRFADIESIMMDNSHPKHDIIITHDLKKLLKEVGQAGNFRFPSKLKSQRSVPINSENFHQYCRYGIRAKEGSQHVEEEFEKVLKELVGWIEECIDREEIR